MKKQIYWCIEDPNGNLICPSDDEWNVREALFWKMVEIDDSYSELLWKKPRKTLFVAKKHSYKIVRCSLVKVDNASNRKLSTPEDSLWYTGKRAGK